MRVRRLLNKSMYFHHTCVDVLLDQLKIWLDFGDIDSFATSKEKKMH